MESKCVVTLGYIDFIMDTTEALTLLGIVSKAERFKESYRDSKIGGNLYYEWEQDECESKFVARLIPESLYRMAKLAGKPTKDN